MKSWKQSCAVFLSVLFMTACTASYQTNPSVVNDVIGAPLQKSKAVLVTTPKDGNYQTIIYKDSGTTAAKETEASFARYATSVTITPEEFHGMKELKYTITEGNYGYVVVPTITHWEQRATAWSGKPSRASIKLTVLNAKTGKEISSTEVDGKTATFTFLHTSPEDLLPGLINTYVDKLYGVTALDRPQ